MSDFNIAIKVDAGSSRTSIDGVKDSLAGAESAAGKTNKALDETGKHLDSVHHKALEVEGSLGQALSGRFGEVGSAFGEIAAKGTIAAGSIVGVGYEVIHLSDEYAHLENAAIKLADGTRATNDVLDEQLSLAGTLHASLEQTMELSDAVKDRTEELNLTNAERLRLTQSLGEAAALENRSVGDAANIIGRLGFALEEGLPAGRAMKDLMRDYPILADVMRDHFGMSTKSIVEMANKGGISMEEFSKAMIDAGDVLDNKMGQRSVGLSAKLGHLKDAVIESKFGLESLADAINPGIRELERYTAALNEHTSGVKKNTDEIMSNVEAVKQLEFNNSELVQTVHELARAMADGGKILDDNAKKYQDSVGKMKAYEFAVNDIKSRLDEIRTRHPDMSLDKMLGAADVSTIRGFADAQQDLTDASSRYGGVVADIHKKERERQRGIEDLSGALRTGRITQAEYNEAIKQYLDRSPNAQLEEEKKILEEMFGAEEKLQLRLRALHSLLDKGKISWDDYNNAQHMAMLDAEGGFKEVSVDAIARAPGVSNKSAISDLDEAKKALLEIRTEVYKGIHEETMRAWKEYDDRVKTTAKNVESYLQPIGHALMDAAKTGEISWQKMGDSILDMLAEIAVKALEAKAAMVIANALTPGPSMPAGVTFDTMGSSLSSLAAMLGGGSTGGDFDIPHAAHGFAGIVRHQSGEDTHLAMFHVKAGEHVQIRTPEQQAQVHAPAMGPVVNHNRVIVQQDPRALLDVLDTPDGNRMIVKLMSQPGVRGAIKAALR